MTGPPTGALVWPGVGALWGNSQSQPLLSGKGSIPQSPMRFSFDWSRGGSEHGKREQSTPFLSAWGAYGELGTTKQRWKKFVALLLLSGLMFAIAGIFLPLVLIRPQKFCLFFTLGSILAMASFAVLRGPIEQVCELRPISLPLAPPVPSAT